MDRLEPDEVACRVGGRWTDLERVSVLRRGIDLEGGHAGPRQLRKVQRGGAAAIRTGRGDEGAEGAAWLLAHFLAQVADHPVAITIALQPTHVRSDLVDVEQPLLKLLRQK